MTAITALGLVRIGRHDVGIPADLVVEIVAGPIDVSPFPCSARHVLGAWVRRGAPVPVIDLASLLRREDEPDPARPMAFTLVIRMPRGVFAVQVDAVMGVIRPAVNDVTGVDVPGDQGMALFSRLYTDPMSRKVAAILDLDAILRIHDLYTAIASEAPIEQTVRAANQVSYLIFSVGGNSYAVPMRNVRHVCLRTGELDSTLQGRIVRGFHRVQTDNLPVVDFAALMGGSDADTGQLLGPCFLVLERNGRSFATCIDELQAIESVEPERIEPLSALGRVGADCVAGTFLERKGRVARVVDADALFVRADVVDRDALFAERTESVEQARVAEPVVSLLVYRVGPTRLATPLIGLQAVIALPPDHVSTGQTETGAAGLCSYQGRTVSLLDLGRLLGRPSVPLAAGQPVLVVDGGEGLRGFRVDAVDYLHSAPLVPLPFPDLTPHGVVPPFTQMIRARRDGRDYAACVLDLAGLTAGAPGASATGVAA
ncbi:MAG TPA: chemotaxis protein CheW [Opitutaceae bacterium]